MCFFKKREKNQIKVFNDEMVKNLPTYYEKYAKILRITNDFYEFQLVNNNEEEFEIYYYGNIIKKHLIIGTQDAKSLIVAKDKNGNEIILFDGFIHGYDNLTWQEYNEYELSYKRELKKLDIGFVKVLIRVTLLDDTSDDWDLDYDNNVITENNKKIPWDIFKRNAITWLSINVVTRKNKKINIIDEELA